jgi:hypothetical protein
MLQIHVDQSRCRFWFKNPNAQFKRGNSSANFKRKSEIIVRAKTARSLLVASRILGSIGLAFNLCAVLVEGK